MAPFIYYLHSILCARFWKLLELFEYFSAICYTTLPPLKSPPMARDGLPLRGGGGGRQVTVSPLRSQVTVSPLRGGIAGQTVVPSTDTSKQNTREATFALMLCQRDSCNTDVNGIPKER